MYVQPPSFPTLSIQTPNKSAALCTDPDTTGAEQLKRERLLEILSQVDLEHLLEREGALTDEISKCSRSLCVVFP